MDINLNVAFDINSQPLSQMIDSLDDPAIILDDSLKVTAKNKKATRIFPNLRKGRAVGGLILPQDKEKIRSLSEKQTVLVELLQGEIVYGATAVRFPKEILLVVRPLSYALRQSLNAVYGKASGYDINITSQEPDKNEILLFSLSNICSPRENRFFNVAAVADEVIKRLSSDYPRVFEKITVNSTLKNNFTMGSEYDFSLILTYIISFCLQCTKERVILELSEEMRVLSVKIIAIPPNNSDEAEELINGFPKDIACWQNLIKMLCDGNLWDLETECGYKKPVAFTVKMPSAEEKQPFVLSDTFKAMLSKLVVTFFG